MRYRNTDRTERVWPALVNADTGTTLQLGPGEIAHVDGDVTDPWLARVRDEKPAKSKPDTTEPEKD